LTHTHAELERLLTDLMSLSSENEWFDFKEAKKGYDLEKIGQYFSALSNEANLHGEEAGWLIFGVTDKKPRKIVGTNFYLTPPGLDRLKVTISQNTNHKITFIQIHELKTKDGRVILFEIPPAPKGIPTEWRGKIYGRIHESLEMLSIDEIDRIRNQLVREDWSAQRCNDASLNDLDPYAIAFARLQYKKKNENNKIGKEVDEWDDITFLNKTKVCVDGKITRAAIILLGKNESDHYLSPGVAKVTWTLRNHKGIEIDYQHFGPPFLLAMEQVFSKIRNLTYRYIPNMRLFPTEISQYDPWVIRETLHNCVAHQDYSLGGRITIVEEPEFLLFTNLGSFLPGSVEEVIHRDSPPEYYRNRILAEAMVNYNMIDTIGSGIKRIFSKQWLRNFPMPDYDLSERERVKVRIFGKVIDEKYTQMLITRTDLLLPDVIALDKVQKGKSLLDEEFKSLKKKKLIEGKRPNLFVSVEVAAATDSKADYIKNKPFDREHYKKMIIALLRNFEGASREEINKLLFDKLSDVLSESQKKDYIKNLLQEMKRDNTITTVGKSRWARWVLSNNVQDQKN